MKEYVVMPLKDYINTCDMVRKYTTNDENDKIKSGDLPQKIDTIFSNGLNSGYANGYEEGIIRGEETGHQKGYAEGYAAAEEICHQRGEKAMLDSMWEALQGGGKRTVYDSTFFNNTNFTKKTFKPKYDIKIEDGYDLFLNCPTDQKLLLAEGQVNMKELEKERGMKFDFSECTNFTKTFSSGLFSELNVIDISNATNLVLAFYGGYISERSKLGLKRIERLICSEKSKFDVNSFGYQGYLTYIGFEGVIGTSINLRYCPLTAQSINKLFACLKDYSAIGGTYTVTLKADRETMLTAEEKAVATNKGWTLVWS